MGDSLVELKEAEMKTEEAINLLDNLIGMVEDSNEADYDTALKMGIKAMKWIPVSEKEPNWGEEYIISVRYNKYRYIDKGRYAGGEWSCYSDEYKVHPSEHIVEAYMPLPKPYRADKEQ